MTLGEKIYQLRKQKRYSQEELAEKLNISRQSVSLWETNQTVPQVDYLIELSKLFEISLDELCNINVECKKESVDQIEDPICSVDFKMDENKANQIVKLLQDKTRVLLIIGFNIMLVYLMIFVRNAFVGLLFIDILFNILFIVVCIRRNKRTKEMLLNNKSSVEINFYDDYFRLYNKSKNAESKYNIKYNEISRLYITKDILIIIFNNKYCVVDIETLKNYKEQILSELKDNAKKIIDYTSTNNPKLKTWSIVLFVGCFISIVFAGIFLLLITRYNKYDFVEGTFVLNSWVLYFSAIIPITSFIFGLVCNKRLKCKKNIITGIIIGVFMCIYGSLFLIFRPLYSFDNRYFEDISKEINIEFPNEYLLVSSKLSLGKETIVKFTNTAEIAFFEKNFEGSSIWSEIKYMPNDFSIMIMNRVSKYDYFYIYEVNYEMYTNGMKVDKLLFTYNIKDNILSINEIYDDPNKTNYIG